MIDDQIQNLCYYKCFLTSFLFFLYWVFDVTWNRNVFLFLKGSSILYQIIFTCSIERGHLHNGSVQHVDLCTMGDDRLSNSNPALRSIYLFEFLFFLYFVLNCYKINSNVFLDLGFILLPKMVFTRMF